MEAPSKNPTSKDSSPILIVEDDRKTASLVTLYLEREGFRLFVHWTPFGVLQVSKKAVGSAAAGKPI